MLKSNEQYHKVAITAEREKEVGKKRAAEANDKDQSLAGAFFTGFLWPIKMLWQGIRFIFRKIGQGLAWLSHKPPLKQIGHGLRRFSRLRIVRRTGRILGLRYLRDSWRELRMVTWPSFSNSARLTGAVIIFSVIFSIFIAIVDFGLDKLFRQILLK